MTRKFFDWFFAGLVGVMNELRFEISLNNLRVLSRSKTCPFQLKMELLGCENARIFLPKKALLKSFN